ncbi:hypothetical protein Tco_0088389 [Tanacetum coccineum]
MIKERVTEITKRIEDNKHRRTRSQSSVIYSTTTTSTTVPPNLVEPPKDTMADNRTMAELLQAPTEGYRRQLVVPN